MCYAAVSMLDEEQHLRVPCIGASFKRLSDVRFAELGLADQPAPVVPGSARASLRLSCTHMRNTAPNNHSTRARSPSLKRVNAGSVASTVALNFRPYYRRRCA